MARFATAKAQAAARPFTHSVVVRPTAFQPGHVPGSDSRVEFPSVYKELIENERRKRSILEDILAPVREGRSPLVLTERRDHLDRLAGALEGRVDHLVVLRGEMRRRDHEAVAARLAAIHVDETRVLLATGKYIGEGSTIHVFDRRCRACENVGYTILLPASAVPGWPSEVPLPADPLSKHDYAASVRRLVRDGVDVPLAGLFLDATHPSQVEGSDGPPFARSAGEGFLYGRLETLPETKGHFRSNGELPIPLDAWSRMEVGLVSDQCRAAIEIDGPLHLADVAAYRRDRRKDRLLQENGYLVLRFLAEDIGKELDAVLDAILRVFVHRGRRTDESQEPR